MRTSPIWSWGPRQLKDNDRGHEGWLFSTVLLERIDQDKYIWTGEHRQSFWHTYASEYRSKLTRPPQSSVKPLVWPHCSMPSTQQNSAKHLQVIWYSLIICSAFYCKRGLKPSRISHHRGLFHHHRRETGLNWYDPSAQHSKTHKWFLSPRKTQGTKYRLKRLWGTRHLQYFICSSTTVGRGVYHDVL